MNANNIQIQVAAAVLQIAETGKTRKLIGEEFGISPRTVTRYAAKFESEARELLAEVQVEPEVQVTKRSGKPRNRRVSIVREVIEELGEGAAVKDIYVRALELSQEASLRDISKGSFTSLIGQIIKKMK